MADPINTIVDELPSPKDVWWVLLLNDSLYCSGVEALTVVDVRTKETELVAGGVGAGVLALVDVHRPIDAPGPGVSDQRIYTPASLDDIGELIPALGNQFRTFAVWPDTVGGGLVPFGMVGTHNGKYLYFDDWNRLKIGIVDIDRPDPQAVGSVPFESYASDLVMSPDDRFIYAALPNEDAVAVIDTTADPWSIEKFPVVNRPYALTLSADGKRLFVAEGGRPNPPIPGSLSVLDTSTMQGQRVDTGKGSDGVVINAAETRAYVSNGSDDTVSVVDVSGTPTVIATISGFHAPGNMCISADDRRLYVAQFRLGHPKRGIAVAAI